jgi:flagellar hook protein FlgE
MGIFGAMTTAISGLSAQSFALENISGNIANSRTTGFKRVDTSFADLVPDMPPRRERSGSVGAFSRNTASVQGDLETSAIDTHMGLSGDGFFMVRERTGGPASIPTFGGNNLYTRRGDFERNSEGFMVNGTGYYLMGYPVDPVTGAATSGTPSPLRINTSNLPARVTSGIDYQANLPKHPYTANYISQTYAPNSDLLSAGLQLALIPASSDAQFQAETIPGQTVTVYDASGSPINIQYRWGKTSNTAGAETWSLYYMRDSAAIGAATKWERVSNTVAFGANGTMTSATSVPFSYSVNGAATPAGLPLNFGTTNLTQREVESSPGTMTGISVSQDGYSTGVFQDIQIGAGGRIVASYSNNQTVAIAEIPLARFAAENLLQRDDGGVFKETPESGVASIQSAGRSLLGGTLENSNTDIAEEFSRMIVTQQAYSANTRVVTTAQSMLQDVINIIR